jgi:hypothetical protein
MEEGSVAGADRSEIPAFALCSNLLIGKDARFDWHEIHCYVQVVMGRIDRFFHDNIQCLQETHFHEEVYGVMRIRSGACAWLNRHGWDK